MGRDPGYGKGTQMKNPSEYLKMRVLGAIDMAEGNGSSYTSKEIVQICARLGCMLTHTPVRDGAAKGKIERFFRTCREQFLCRQLDLSGMDTLNRQFTAWVEEHYNATKHSVLGMSPLDRFALDRRRIR